MKIITSVSKEGVNTHQILGEGRLVQLTEMLEDYFRTKDEMLTDIHIQLNNRLEGNGEYLSKGAIKVEATTQNLSTKSTSKAEFVRDWLGSSNKENSEYKVKQYVKDLLGCWNMLDKWEQSVVQEALEELL